MKEKATLANLPELTHRLTYSVIKFNSKVVSTTQNLNRNGFSAPDLLRQLFLAYLVWPDKNFHNYIVAKQNKSEEGFEFSVGTFSHSCSTI